MRLRNVAIIAHVDHGKTTLVDQMFRQSGTFRENQRVAERAMDSNELEKERGITILAKCTSASNGPTPATHETTHINIVDTPGHADFGGEVERILSMVDGVILLVDAAEGPMPQTKFVTGKALALGLKSDRRRQQDRPLRRPRTGSPRRGVRPVRHAGSQSDEQLEFPVLFASGRNGYVGRDSDVRSGDLTPLFETVVKPRPRPRRRRRRAIQDAGVAARPRFSFVGRILTGRILSGTLKLNMPIRALNPDGTVAEEGRAAKIFAFQGLERVPVEEASAGAIIAIAGLTKATVADTIADINRHRAAPRPADRPADASDDLQRSTIRPMPGATAARSPAG